MTVIVQLILGPDSVTEEHQSFRFDCVLKTQCLNVFGKVTQVDGLMEDLIWSWPMLNRMDLEGPPMTLVEKGCLHKNFSFSEIVPRMTNGMKCN